MKKILLLAIFWTVATQISFSQIDYSELGKNLSPLLKEMDAKVLAGDYETITSILIAKDSKLIYEKYYNKNDSSSTHNTRSATKTMATLLTGIAIDKGFIKSEKDKIFKYLQHKLPCKNPDKRKENIMIEDLLTMSSMLESSDNNFLSRGHEERMYYIEDWTQFFIDLPIRSYPFGPKPSEQPYGRAFSYSSAQAATVAEIVQSAIGSNLVDFAKKHLLEPLGIKEENYTLHYTPLNILNTAGGSEYRSRDFMKLIQLCNNKGVWNGKQIISADWIEKASTPKANAREGVDYGYFLWMNEFGNNKKYQAYYMSGNGGQKVLAIPELNLSVVITTRNYNNRRAHGYTDELMNKFIVPTFEKKN